MYLIKNIRAFLYSILRIYSIDHDNQKITFTNRFKRFEIFYNDVEFKVTYLETFLSRKLNIKLNSEFKAIKIQKSFSEHDITRLNIKITKFKKNIISINALEVEEKYSEYNYIWNSDNYLRSKTILNFINSTQNLLRLDEDYYWSLLSNETSKEQLSALKSLYLNYREKQKKKNEDFINSEVNKYKTLFDTVEKKPLTDSQRKACVTNEENNLVLAGAGSGKTSVMVGRCAYLIESKLAVAEDILVLAFNNDAAKELNQRIKERIPNVQIEAQTFHKAGKEIIKIATGKESKLTEFKDSMLLKKFFTTEIQKEIISNYILRMELLSTLHPEQLELKSEFEFETKAEYDNYVKENNFRTLNKELVKSFGEIEIANYLFKNGVNYKYEEEYEVNTASSEYAQYRPDFYLPDYKIYIEYYGLDKAGNTAPYIDKKEYTQSIHWKRELHKTHKTIIIELFYSDLQDGLLIPKLEKYLDSFHVKRKTEASENQLVILNDFLKNFKISDSILSIFQVIESSNIDFDEANIRLLDKNPKKSELATLKLAKIMYEKYQDQLTAEGAIDFHQMIALGATCLKQNKFQSKWKHILIDEFQDISDIRLEFIMALIGSCPATLFCVGDDWQTIYGFTGSKVEITANFSKMLGDSFEIHLDKTFRFNDKISEVATKFIVQNPIQIKKDIQTVSKSVDPAIEISFVRSSNQYLEEIKNFLNKVAVLEIDQKVMMLSRNNETLRHFQIDYEKKLKSDYPKLKFSFMTIHSSKGLEADFVILLGLDGGMNGFPSEREFDSINVKLQKTSETYPFAEERRVFYVALTRAKHNVLLISDINNPSIFARELLNGKFEVSSKQVKKSCPNCNNGFLIVRTSRENNKFLGCTNFSNSNQCRYTETYLEKLI
jgi:DNA helicase-4